MGKGKREVWVDIAKAIAIIAVVIGHIEVNFTDIGWLPSLSRFIYLWHVPVFFMIAGFFIRDDKLLCSRQFIVNKLLSLYLPAVALYSIVILFHNSFIDWGWYGIDVDYGGKHVQYLDLMGYVKALVLTLLCGGREPILGAMWFVFVLLFALCGLSVVTYIAQMLQRGRFTMERLRFAALLTMALISFIATKYYGIMIPRFSNVFSAMWLIYIGMWVKRGVQFSNGKIATGALIIVFSACYFLDPSGFSLNVNRFDGIVSLTFISVAALYSVCYLSRIIETTTIGKALKVVGRESFSVMAFHFVGFKLCSMLVSRYMDVAMTSLVAKCDDSVVLFVLYMSFGVGVPIVLVKVYRSLLKIIRKVRNSYL